MRPFPYFPPFQGTKLSLQKSYIYHLTPRAKEVGYHFGYPAVYKICVE